MKKISLLLVFLLSFMGLKAQDQPKFSTDGNETWYTIQFLNGKGAIQDMGDNIPLETAQEDGLNNEAQQWKFVGSMSNFEAINKKTGRHIVFEGERFVAKTDVQGKLKFIKSKVVGGMLEIGAYNTGGQTMNQFGGQGVGKQIGKWNSDPGNPLMFVTPGKQIEEPTVPQPEPIVLSQEGAEPTWYYIQFKKGDGVVTDDGEDVMLITKNATVNDTKLWKIVGTSLEDCEMVNKATGRKIYFDTTPQDFDKAGRFKAGKQDGHLFIRATKLWDYAPAWEIGASNTGTHTMNQAGGQGIGKHIGKWSSDPGNPLRFVLTKDIRIVETDDLPQAVEEYTCEGSTSYKPKDLNTLWYTQPAISKAKQVDNPWMEYALPIGNGEFGAMIHAGVRRDLIQFNEKTLWGGSVRSRSEYKNFGHLYIDNLDGYTSSIKDYVRYLDIDNAVAGMEYKSPDGNTTFTREYIASNPDKAIVIRMKAEGSAKLNNKFFLYDANGAPAKYKDGVGSFADELKTAMKDQFIAFNAQIKVVAKGGTTTTDETGITVNNADEITIYLVGDTNYEPLAKTYTYPKAELVPNMTERLNAVSAKDFASIKSAHTTDYKAIYDRVKLDLKGAVNDVDTEQLVKDYNDVSYSAAKATPKELMLELLYFNYGRYMLISSSRGIAVPNNLQGIWNNRNDPAWGSDIHTNINIQMNYWPSEPLNMSEMHLPLLEFVSNQATKQPQWSDYAQLTGQTKGWTIFTESDIFGNGSTFSRNYVVANAWYCAHLYQHYRYTLDKDYLKKTALPAMISCSDYWLERLVKADDGKWEAPNEWSPEHGPTENGVAHAQQLVWDLFNNTIKGIEALGTAEAGVTQEYLDALKEKFANLDTGLATEQANGKTILREWKYSPVTVGEGQGRGHRHMSHLMALYPLTQVGPDSEYFQPIVNSMELRGDKSTGWSMGWKINLWARALNGNRARKLIKTALTHSTSYGTDQGRGGIYYNLFDSHAPFQIDGNFGATAGVAEMLLQSQFETINLLPALPDAWGEGSVTGLKAVNNFEVGMDWADGKLKSVDVKSNKGGACKLHYKGIAKAKFTDKNGAEIKVTKIDDDTVVFDTQVGDTFKVDLTKNGTVPVVAVNQEQAIKVVGNIVYLPYIAQTSVYNLKGQLVLQTNKDVFTLPEQAGNKVFILKCLFEGQTKVHKVALQ